MGKYEYVGCFFDYDELFEKVKNIRKNPLKNTKTKPHITFKYAPIDVFPELFGEELEVEIIGYGNDGDNEGVCVIATSKNNVLTQMIQDIQIPHITLAVSDNGLAVNTKNLVFHSIIPIKITGKYDGHIDD